MLSVGGDRSALLWDVATARVIRKLGSHPQKINTCAFNDDASMAATGSYDRTVSLWDIRCAHWLFNVSRASSREAVQTLGEAFDSVSSVQIRTLQILTASVDGHVRNYDIRFGRVFDDNLLGTCLTELQSIESLVIYWFRVSYEQPTDPLRACGICSVHSRCKRHALRYHRQHTASGRPHERTLADTVSRPHQ
jgi:WD40 repeat protein